MMVRMGKSLRQVVWAGSGLAVTLAVCQMMAAQTTAGTAVKANGSYVAPDGTAHVARVVPVPLTVSPEARRSLSRPASDANKPQSLAERRTGTDAWQARAGALSQKLYPADVAAATMAGVPVRVITPAATGTAKVHTDRVLMNLHGGGFNSDSGSLTETVPIASLTQTKVVAVLYRLAPEHPFPAGLDDAVAVYRELLKSYRPEKIAVYGTSAGAILTAEFAVKVKQMGLPEPAALGIFSGHGDFSRKGDSENIYALNGFSGYLGPGAAVPSGTEYVGGTNRKDPVLSPIFADLKGMPPALFVTSGRDLLLSGTSNLHRAFYEAGGRAELVVFDALPHAFWNDPELPEAKEADRLMAAFFTRELSR